MYETVEGGDEAVSALSFVVISCSGWQYIDGGLEVLAHFEVVDEGEGEVSNPLEYPAKRNGFPSHSLFLFLLFLPLHFILAYSPVQLTLPCGGVLLRVQIYGYGDTYNSSVSFTVGELVVASWENEQQEVYERVKRDILASPNGFVGSVFLFSSLKTTTQVFCHCTLFYCEFEYVIMPPKLI